MVVLNDKHVYRMSDVKIIHSLIEQSSTHFKES